MQASMRKETTLANSTMVPEVVGYGKPVAMRRKPEYILF